MKYEVDSFKDFQFLLMKVVMSISMLDLANKIEKPESMPEIIP